MVENDLDHELREILKKMLFEVAKQFFDASSKKFLQIKRGNKKNFIKSLTDFVENKGDEIVHIVTTNYDRLLYGYEKFFKNTKDGFNRTNPSSNLIFNDQDFAQYHEGCYLHLQGSPLFVEENGKIRKKKIQEFADDQLDEQAFDEAMSNHHLVLTAPYHKERIINESSFLNSYWKKFEEIIKNTDVIVFVGYGGEDPHINELVRNRNQRKESCYTHVIEWNFSKKLSDTEYKKPNWFNEKYRKLLWQAKFNISAEKLEYHPVDNILNTH